MWHILEKISEQVTNYSTCLGQLWYLCVFVFRLIVVVTIGGAVYGDEQSVFECSTMEPGCRIMCFNEFSKLSHIRFWAFQLLAIAVPVVIFHFYSMIVVGQIEKLRKDEAIKAEEGEMDSMYDPSHERDFEKMARRRRSIGHVKVKKIYAGGDLKEIPFTNKIHTAYFLSIIARLVVEGVFIYLAYYLFKFVDITNLKMDSALDFIWIRIPAMFSCTATSSAVENACYNAIVVKKNGHVPCWVSRPWEKTIYIRYMNVMSVICFILCALELIYLTVRWLKSSSRKRRSPKNLLLNGLHKHGHRHDSVFDGTGPSAHHMYHETLYPTLAVPIRHGGRYVESKRSRTASMYKR